MLTVGLAEYECAVPDAEQANTLAQHCQMVVSPQTKSLRFSADGAARGECRKSWQGSARRCWQLPSDGI